MPEAVKNVMQGYRADNDWLGDFLEECTEKGEGFTCPSGQLYKTYRNYCAERGEYVRGNAAFYDSIKRLGFAKEKKHGGTIIYGMQLVKEYRNLS